MLLVGGSVEGGLIGDHPSLRDLDDGDLRFAIDFRSVYASILDNWLEFPSQEILGGRFEPLDLVARQAGSPAAA